jgi:hypothetical protein
MNVFLYIIRDSESAIAIYWVALKKAEARSHIYLEEDIFRSHVDLEEDR